jgi:hypothetical protein
MSSGTVEGLIGLVIVLLPIAIAMIVCYRGVPYEKTRTEEEDQ